MSFDKIIVFPPPPLKCTHTLELATSFSCSPFDWFKCAAKVAECASVCSDGITEPACISCFGGAYDQCKGCIGLGSTELQSAVSQENALGGMIVRCAI